jgi:capsular polysaccharide export protein
MNIAYLDPAYSRHFHRLAGTLARRTGGNAVALLSSPAYRMYTAGDRALVWKPGLSDHLRELPPEFEHATWAPMQDARSMAVFAHAVEWFKQRYTEERIDLCLVFSDARPFSVAARLAAAECGVVLLYFERGAFRYSTSSLSTLGLNSRFSLRRAEQLPGIAGVAAEERLERRPVEPWLRLRFARFIVRNAIACAIDRDRGRIQHKRYAITPYLRLAWAQWLTEHHFATRSDAIVQAASGRPLVIVPLQLQTDSQLVLHSPFANNQAFIDFVAAEAARVAPDALLLFKRHPMDATRYRLPRGAAMVDGNLARYHAARPVFVCVNSTVGFEALVRGERVICFAPSFYADAPTLVLATPQTFADRLVEVLAAAGDAAAGRELRASVLRCYQAPGDAWAYSAEDVEATAEVVLKHFRAARLALVPKAAPAAASSRRAADHAMA